MLAEVTHDSWEAVEVGWREAGGASEIGSGGSSGEGCFLVLPHGLRRLGPFFGMMRLRIWLLRNVTESLGRGVWFLRQILVKTTEFSFLLGFWVRLYGLPVTFLNAKAVDKTPVVSSSEDAHPWASQPHRRGCCSGWADVSPLPGPPPTHQLLVESREICGKPKRITRMK